MLKDYYSILQLSPQATQAEVKQAYRRLAMIYHPDKNPGDPFARSQFTEIKEAYEVLTNPLKKEIYLQQQWYNQSIGKKRMAETISPVAVLKLSLELEQYVSTLSTGQLSKDGLFSYMQELLGDDTIEKLRQFGDEVVNGQIITTLLSAMKPLPLGSVQLLSVKLENLAGNDKGAVELIHKSLLKFERAYLWEKYKIALMLIFTMLICLLIYFASR